MIPATFTIGSYIEHCKFTSANYYQ